MSATTTKTGQQPATRLSSLAAQIHQASSPLAVPAVSADVRSTTDYSIFQSIASNRPVMEEHVRLLMEQIRQKDFLYARPIDVNHEFGVVDGQHRLEAAKRLGRPIYYQFSQLTEDDMAALNRASRNWKNTDFLHYWASKGKPAYVACAEFLHQYPAFTLSLILPILASKQCQRGATAFRDGLFQIDAGGLEKAARIAAFLERVKREANFKLAYHLRFIEAINHCLLMTSRVDLEVLLRKILQQPSELQPCVKMKQYVGLLERLYNYKTHDQNKVRFS